MHRSLLALLAFALAACDTGGTSAPPDPSPLLGTWQAARPATPPPAGTRVPSAVLRITEAEGEIVRGELSAGFLVCDGSGACGGGCQAGGTFEGRLSDGQFGLALTDHVSATPEAAGIRGEFAALGLEDEGLRFRIRLTAADETCRYDEVTLLQQATP